MTTVDIILFCYKQEQYIEQALRSIYAQELPKDVTARIIVADDCSPDDTLKIIKRISSESPFPMEFLPEESNMGISKNYKRSFAATKADYVAILEGDDYWLPNHLKQHIEFLRKHRKYSMSINSITFLEEGKSFLSGWAYPNSYVAISVEDQIACGNQLGNLTACVFRGDYLRALPAELFDQYIADWELGILIAQNGPICKFRESTSVYRVNPHGQWTQCDMRERTRSRIESINLMNAMTNYKYCSQFMIVQQRIENSEPFSIVPYSRGMRIRIACRSFAKRIKNIFGQNHG